MPREIDRGHRWLIIGIILFVFSVAALYKPMYSALILLGVGACMVLYWLKFYSEEMEKFGVRL
jgi:hypothetical protein